MAYMECLGYLPLFCSLLVTATTALPVAGTGRTLRTTAVPRAEARLGIQQGYGVVNDPGCL